MGFGKRAFEQFELQEKRLESKEADVEKVLAANAYRKDMLITCINWLNEVEEEKQKIEELKKRCEESRHSSSLDLRLGMKVMLRTKKMGTLRKQINIDKIMNQSAPALPGRFIKRDARNIDDFPSLGTYVETLFKKLLVKDDDDHDKYFQRICIWGPPGVGKTTVLENVHDRFCELTNTDQSFDNIFWVTMTEEKGVVEIQQILEERLGLHVDQENYSSERAAQISKELENKRYLLFLDQVSSQIDLEKVGIYDYHKRGKVVFACSGCNSNEEIDELCGSWIHKDIKIEGLSVEDALKMFNRIVGKDIMKNKEIKRIATSIVKECHGRPQLINRKAFKLRKEWTRKSVTEKLRGQFFC